MSPLVTIHKDRVYEVINLNRKGIKPTRLITEAEEKQTPKEFGTGLLNDDSITRFDEDSVKSQPKRRRKRRKSSVRRRKNTNRSNRNKNKPNRKNDSNKNKGKEQDGK